ncbi:MAG: WhiB family transcriptional regulator [Propionibacteriaceae bacterium]|nr:WhiB family transcriptional regulator [Propionibacteriaceae bacterium]
MSSATFTSRPESVIQGCHEFASLFQHPLLEEPPTGSAPSDQQHEYNMLTRKAENICHSCPLQQRCLYDAVVKHDVAGFAGGTTARQRTEIRNRLGITVTPEDFDTLAGITARNRHVDHDEVVRLRLANPHESLETLAHRLGCSLSTVKRHLRRHRNEAHRPRVQALPRPSLAEVLAAFRAVVAPASIRRAA